MAVNKKEGLDAKVIAEPKSFRRVASHHCTIVQAICPHGYSPVSELLSYPWYHPHEQEKRFKAGTVHCLQDQYFLPVGEAREKYKFNHWTGFSMIALEPHRMSG